MVPLCQEYGCRCPLPGWRPLRWRTNQHPLYPLPLSASTPLFKSVPLPSKITSWLTLLLLWLPVKQQLVEKHTRTKLGRGTNTPNGANNAKLATTYSSTDSPDSTRSRSWAPSPWLSVKDGFFDKAMISWLKNQSLIPSTLWLRPSKNTDARTRRKMSTITLQDFYTDNWGPTKRTTRKVWNKKPFPFASFASFSPTDWLNSNEQWATSQQPPTSGPCVHASIWRSQRQSSDRQSSFAFATLPLSKMAKSLTIPRQSCT